MQRHRMHPLGAVRAIDVVGGPDHGRLGLPVGGPWLVVVQDTDVVEVETAMIEAVRRRRHPDDAGVKRRGATGAQRGQEKRREGKMGQVVHGKLPLEAVHRDSLWASHNALLSSQSPISPAEAPIRPHTCIVDQHVESGRLGKKFPSGTSDRVERVQVHLDDFDDAVAMG